MSELLPAEHFFRDAGKDFKTRLEVHGVLDIEVRTVMTVVLAAVEEERGVPAMRHHGAASGQLCHAHRDLRDCGG